MAKRQREILVLNRYQIKQDCPEKGLHKGDVVLHIRNDQDKEYYTVLRRSKAHSCNCVAGQNLKRCYHVTEMVKLENSRYDAAKAAKANDKAMSDALYAKLAALNEAKSEKVVDIRGNLNGAQQSAGLLAILPSRQQKDVA